MSTCGKVVASHELGPLPQSLTAKKRPPLARFFLPLPGVFFFCLGGPDAEILEKPDRPLRCPYLPTYLPTLLMGN